MDCTSQACGGFEFRFATEVLPAPAMFVNLNAYHFLSARTAQSAFSILVSGSANARFVQIIRVGDSSAAEVATSVPIPANNAARPVGDRFGSPNAASD